VEKEGRMRKRTLVLLLVACVVGLAGASIAPADATQGSQANASTAASPPGLGGFVTICSEPSLGVVGLTAERLLV
jgi:cytochrome c553